MWRSRILSWSHHCEGQKDAKNKLGSQWVWLHWPQQTHSCLLHLRLQLLIYKQKQNCPNSLLFQAVDCASQLSKHANEQHNPWAIHLGIHCLCWKGTHFPSTGNGPDVMVQLHNPQFGIRLPSAFWSFPETTICSLLSPPHALCLHRLPQRLPSAWCSSQPWLEGGWMVISSPLKNWSGRISFPWCNIVKATGMSSQRATHTSGLSTLLFLLRASDLCTHPNPQRHKMRPCTI